MSEPSQNALPLFIPPDSRLIDSLQDKHPGPTHNPMILGTSSTSDAFAMNLSLGCSRGLDIAEGHQRIPHTVNSVLNPPEAPSVSALSIQDGESLSTMQQGPVPLALMPHPDLMPSLNTIPPSYFSTSTSRVPTGILYPNIYSQNSTQLLVPSGEKTYEVIGNNPLDKDFRKPPNNDQPRSLTDAKYFKRKLSFSKSIEDKPYDAPCSVYQTHDGLHDNRHVADKYAPRLSPGRMPRIEKPIPVSFSTRGLVDKNVLMDLDATSRQDLMPYRMNGSVTSSIASPESSMSSYSRRGSDEQPDHISVWRPY